MEQIRQQLIDIARKECHTVTQQLYCHLKKDNVISYLDTWTEEESPDVTDNDLDVTRFEAKDMILKKLLNVIQTWENDTRIVERATQQLTDLFNKECLVISQKCKEVSEILKGGSLSDGGGLVLGGGGGSESTENAELEGIHIAILVATAPIWVPVGLAALAIFVPIGLGYRVVDSIRRAFERKEYRKNKAIFMKKWTHILLEDLHKKENISNLIEGIYLKSMIERINYLFSTFLPKQIEADRAQLLSILNDKRSADQIIYQFQPKKLKVKSIVKSLLLFDLRYLADDVIDISKILRYRQIGGGSFSDVYRATWRQSDGSEKEVALKILKGHDMYLQLCEVDCSRKLRHKNIVDFYGVIFAERERCQGRIGLSGNEIGLPLYDDRLMLVQELCDQSLESLVFGTKDKQCGSFSKTLRRGETHEFFFNMCSSICEGLSYMHSTGYLHRDLKLSNVLVINGVGKLSDLGFARAEAVVSGTSAGTLSHMAPELLEEKVYSFSSDVYSLGILTWELWYGTRSYSDADFAGFGVAQFIDAVKRGKRPNCDKEHTMMVELINLVQQCWSNDPKRRPIVQQVGFKLRKIDEKYRRDISR
ncbi:RGS domain-containing serine/threonine-protein kinase A-like [Ruditapes philippinarum]|uniref:RGS domain-containing serine/threonine-protein kinase A-like n=1 Tax=Ruditapes philippinarum TaxID=129788 RepID=UPI00295AF553|nr:RGS domain-containing serine/threonine-protein kinase A-like [Ruditapes philippinarum]